MQRIVPPGTQIVANDGVAVVETGNMLPRGAVGVIVPTPRQLHALATGILSCYMCI